MNCSTIVVTDKTTGNSILKEMRQKIWEVMRTEKFEEEAPKLLGFCTSLWQVAAVGKDQVNLSKPWPCKLSNLFQKEPIAL